MTGNVSKGKPKPIAKLMREYRLPIKNRSKKKHMLGMTIVARIVSLFQVDWR